MISQARKQTKASIALSSGFLQRRAVRQAKPEAVPPIVHEVLRSPGQPLDAATRKFMEPRFGQDFSRVRVHTDGRAAESARAVNALAYTIGNDVVFGSDDLNRGTEDGRRLLSHELTHVVQQSNSNMNGGNLELGASNSAHELEAESVSSHLIDTPGEAPRFPMALTLGHIKAGVLQRLGPAAAAGAGAAAGVLSFEAALSYAQSLSTRYPGWLSVLSSRCPCPCTEPDVSASGTWEQDTNPFLSWFHPGAASSYRSKSTFSSVPGTAHGQQCTYDSNGRLITEGPGAGTPDVWSPTANTPNHLLYDAATWQVLGWRIYNRYWVPNNSNGCVANRGENTVLRRISEILP